MHTMHSVLSSFSIFLFLFFLNCDASLIYLTLQSEVAPQNMYQLLVQPQKNAYLVLKKIGSVPPLMGILATYAGYMTTSNEFGEIIFPRHQEKTPLYVAITEEIIPIMRFEGTIDHWEFSNTKQITFIEINLQQSSNKDRPSTNFTVQTIPTPEDNIIPYATITIFADPDDFEINEGIFPYDGHDTHWILPPLIVKDYSSIAKNTINALPNLHFFRPLTMATTRKSTKELIRLQQ